MVRNVSVGKYVQKPRNGSGALNLFNIMSTEEMTGKLTLFAKVILEPFSEIGYHIHSDDREAYYIFSGEGIFIDANKERVDVKDGDICLIDKGEGHGIINTSANPMVIIALVIE